MKIQAVIIGSIKKDLTRMNQICNMLQGAIAELPLLPSNVQALYPHKNGEEVLFADESSLLGEELVNHIKEAKFLAIINSDSQLSPSMYLTVNIALMFEVKVLIDKPLYDSFLSKRCTLMCDFMMMKEIPQAVAEGTTTGWDINGEM
jgi:hypothetical protein